MSCEMNPHQIELYEATKYKVKEMMNLGAKTMSLLPYLTRLRQLCIDPATYIEDYDYGSGKIDALMNIIEEKILDNHRMLIFSSFVTALNIIEKRLNKKGISYFMITGDTSAESRLSICNEFNANDDIFVVLISLKAGGTGLNLTGADTVIHVDPWWNVSAQNQATDRAHRIGQTRNLKVIKLICSDSIEQRVIELQNMKKDLIDKVISNDESSITKITQEDIKFILS